MANRSACDISDTVSCLDLKGAAGGEHGLLRCQIADADRAGRKCQEFDICECVGAVTARNPVAYDNVLSDNADGIVTDVAGELRCICSISAVDEVVADATCNHIIAGAAVDDVVVSRSPDEPILMI